MDIIELIAIIILVAAIVFLIYYYIQTSNGNEVDLKEIFHIPPNREDENANVSVNGSNQKKQCNHIRDNKYGPNYCGVNGMHWFEVACNVCYQKRQENAKPAKKAT